MRSHLVRPGVAARRDGRLEVDDAQVRCRAVKLLQRIAPRVGGGHRGGDRAASGLGQVNVPPSVPHAGLVQPRVAAVLHDLCEGRCMQWPQDQLDGEPGTL